MKKLVLALGFVVALIGFMAVDAQALPIIEGRVNFSGVVTLDTTTIADSTKITKFTDVIAVNPISGSYLGVGGQSVFFSTPIEFATYTVPTGELWSFDIGSNHYSFEAKSITYTKIGGVFLNISGVGIASITGYANTWGTWSITVPGTGEGPTFSFTSDNRAVPEPATLLLLGVGLLGAGLYRRTRKG